MSNCIYCHIGLPKDCPRDLDSAFAIMRLLDIMLNLTKQWSFAYITMLPLLRNFSSKVFKVFIYENILYVAVI
jgi:hypothetical protein